MSPHKHLLAVALGGLAVTLTACGKASPVAPPPPVTPSSAMSSAIGSPPLSAPPAQGTQTSLSSMMPATASNCDGSATAPLWFDGNQPDSLMECQISPDGNADYVYAYQWSSDPGAPGQFLSELAGGANGDGPTSVTQAGSIASCPTLTVGGGCQFSWSGSGGSGEGLYYQAGYGNEDLYWTVPAQGAVLEIEDYSGGNDLAAAELALTTWWMQNVQGG